MKLEYSKLRGKIIEKYGTQGNFAAAAGVSEISVSRKMAGKTSFSKYDMETWCDLLDIDRKDVGIYFFA